MCIDKHEIEQRIQHFANVCRSFNLKVTHQRLEIFREVAQSRDHPDAEKIFRNMRKKMPTISLDTVYRTLWMLADLGLAKTLGASRERTLFDANLKPHHHFVCVLCGVTVDFYNNKLDDLQVKESVRDIGYVEAMQLEVRGICHRCASKNKQPNK